MHPCLGIDETAVHICSSLSSSDLLSVALTCTQLKEPALSALWADIDWGGHPFMRLLPKDVWDEVIDSNEEDLARRYRQVVLRRPLIPTDWLLLAIAPYTQYVRDISLNHSTVSEEFGDLAARAFHSTHMLPNLRKIYILEHADVYISFLTILLTPSLTHVDFGLVSATEDAITMLSLLGAICTSLVHLQCTHASPDDFLAIRNSISQVVPRWTELKGLGVPCLTGKGLRHISQLAQLTFLELHCKHDTGVVLDDMVTPLEFQSLSVLVVHYCALDNMTELLNALNVLTIKRVELSLPHGKGLTGYWKKNFNAVAQRSSAAIAREVKVSRFIDDQDGLMKIDALYPLFAARNLALLDLHDCRHFDLNDTFIEELAKASPNLAVLNFGTWCAADENRKLTLNAYSHVFTHCPKTRMLSLTVNASNVRECLRDIADEERIVQHGKHFSLYVGNSEVENPVQVATFLSWFFYEPMKDTRPSDSGYWSTLQLSEGWFEVMRLLPKIVSERIQG